MKISFKEKIFVLVLLLFSSCARNFAGDGVLIGHAFGDSFGAVIGHRIGKESSGSSIGAGIGMVSGGFIHDLYNAAQEENKQRELEDEFNKNIVIINNYSRY